MPVSVRIYRNILPENTDEGKDTRQNKKKDFMHPSHHAGVWLGLGSRGGGVTLMDPDLLG